MYKMLRHQSLCQGTFLVRKTAEVMQGVQENPVKDKCFLYFRFVDDVGNNLLKK